MLWIMDVNDVWQCMIMYECMFHVVWSLEKQLRPGGLILLVAILRDRKCICFICSSAAGPRIQLPTLAGAGTSSFLVRPPRASQHFVSGWKWIRKVKNVAKTNENRKSKVNVKTPWGTRCMTSSIKVWRRRRSSETQIFDDFRFPFSALSSPFTKKPLQNAFIRRFV